MSGDFFAIGKPQWSRACELGLNAAVAYLVLARGTQADNVTTRWSANAIEEHAGISWRRADSAIAQLEEARLATKVPTSKKKFPTRKLTLPAEAGDMIWLPNTLIDGVGGKDSPVARLRQTQEADYLQAFVELYGDQNLAADGGLPRSMVVSTFARSFVCDAGQFRVYGFDLEDELRCRSTGALARFHQKREAEGRGSVWDFLDALRALRLLECVHYLAEDKTPDSELMHPLSGDSYGLELADLARASTESMPGWVWHQRDKHQFLVPVLRHIPAPEVVGVYRLIYRPHTRVTAARWAKDGQACERYESIYAAIGRGDYQGAMRG